MGKVGIIAVIPREYSEKDAPFEAALARQGKSRMPGTAVWVFPYKEVTGQYRTGLDVNSVTVKRIADEHERSLKIKEIEENVKFIKEQLGDEFDISPRSKYYNYTLNTNDDDNMHTRAVKLEDGDNMFNLEDPRQLLTWCWLSSHPSICPSLQAYREGKYQEAHFYVKMSEVEEQLQYKKVQSRNKALAKLDILSVEKQTKVARLLGLGIGPTTLPTRIYNMLSEFIGKGDGNVELFNKFADMKEDVIYVKDLLEQAIYYNVFRETKGGKIEEGGETIGNSKQEVAELLLGDQMMILALEEKLKAKKSLG